MSCDLHRCTYYAVCNREQILRGSLITCYVNSDIGSRDNIADADNKQNSRESKESNNERD